MRPTRLVLSAWIYPCPNARRLAKFWRSIFPYWRDLNIQKCPWKPLAHCQPLVFEYTMTRPNWGYGDIAWARCGSENSILQPYWNNIECTFWAEWRVANAENLIASLAMFIYFFALIVAHFIFWGCLIYFSDSPPPFMITVGALKCECVYVIGKIWNVILMKACSYQAKCLIL